MTSQSDETKGQQGATARVLVASIRLSADDAPLYQLHVFDDDTVTFDPDVPDTTKIRVLSGQLALAVMDREYLLQSLVETTTAVRSLVSIALTVQSDACQRARAAKDLLAAYR